MKKIFALVCVGLFLSTTLHARSSRDASGLRSRKTVLSGALIRAGGSGGMNSLRDSTIQSLCSEGIDTVYYLYPSKNFTNEGMHKCGGNSLSYRGGAFRGNGVYDILEAVHSSIQNGRGPVLVHCWNGWHAAGEVAAKALMQFCGYTGDQAASYWTANLGDDDKSKYNSVRSRIRSFQPRSDLKISSSQQQRVCP